MFRLREKSDPFFAAFTAHARVTVRASGLLRQLFERPMDVAGLKQEITSAEHEGDEITRATIVRLRSQWITPLDRPDIHTLTTRLDDVLDVIESIAERILLFDIREISAIASDAARVLESSVVAMSKAVDLLPEARSRAPEILALCGEISKLESEADALYRSAIAAHHRRRDHGRPQCYQTQRGPLGRRNPDAHRLAAHHPRRRPDRLLQLPTGLRPRHPALTRVAPARPLRRQGPTRLARRALYSRVADRVRVGRAFDSARGSSDLL